MWSRLEPHLRELAKRAGMRDVPPRVVAATIALALAAVIWAAWRWWPVGESAARGQAPAAAVVSAQAKVETQAPVDNNGGGTAAPPNTELQGEESQGTTLVVHVAGQVHRPGVYELPSGARVIDSLEAAGGALGSAATQALNLARPLSDGEQVLVPSEEEVANGTFAAQMTGSGNAAASGGVGSTSGIGASAGAGTKVNINTADVSALDTLPGVGPSTAQKIVADREANGPFSDPEDLGRVSGIGPKKLEQLKDLVSVR